MLNLIEAQETLKQVPDGQLVQEMQRPSGNLPPFLVLGEMQRRQKMRQEAASQQAQQQAGGTVAQDLTQQTGLAALTQMRQQQGIQQPGMQPAMQPGMVPGMQPGMSQGAPQQPQPRPAGIPAMMARGGPVYLSGGGDPNDPNLTPFEAFRLRRRQSAEQEIARQRRVAEIDGVLRPYGTFGRSGPLGYFSTPQGQRGDANAIMEEAARQRQRLIESPPEDFARFRQDPLAFLREIPPPPPDAPPVPGATPAPMDPGTNEEPLPTPPLPPPQGRNRAQGGSGAAIPAPPPSPPETAQQQQAQPDRFEALLERMIASRGDPEARRAQQRDMALLQFGLGLMGSRSPTFGGALNEAGVPALASYTAAQREAERTDRQSLDDQIQLERYRTERDWRTEEARRREASDNRRFGLQEQELAIQRARAGRERENPVERAIAAYGSVFGENYNPADPNSRRNLFSLLGRDPMPQSERVTPDRALSAIRPQIERLTEATRYGLPRNATPEQTQRYNDDMARLRELRRIEQDFVDRMIGFGGISNQPRNPDRVVPGVQ